MEDAVAGGEAADMGNLRAAQRHAAPLDQRLVAEVRTRLRELHGDGVRNEARLHAPFEEEPDRLASAIAVVEGPVVHVHAHKGVGLAAVESARVLHGVVEGRTAMLEREGDARAKVPRDFRDERRPKVLAHDVAAERERQPRFAEPPLAHVGHEVKPAVAEGELPLVDQEPQVDRALDHGILDQVEAGWHRLEVGLVQPEREVGAGQRARDRDALATHGRPGHWRAGDEARAVPVAERGAVRQQGVAIGDVGVGMDRDRGDLELAAARALVQRLDVLKFVNVGEAFRVNPPVGERPEHEGIVRIRAVGDVNRGHAGPRAWRVRC